MTPGQVILMVVIHVVAPFIMVPGVLGLLAVVGGWRRLAQAFPKRPKGPGVKGSMASIRLGAWCGYNNCVGWHADDEYLHLELPWLFAFAHPPLSLPWIAMDLSNPKEKWGLFGRARQGVIGGTKILLPEKMIKRELENRRLLAEAQAEAGTDPSAEARVPAQG